MPAQKKIAKSLLIRILKNNGARVLRDGGDLGKFGKKSSSLVSARRFILRGDVATLNVLHLSMTKLSALIAKEKRPRPRRRRRLRMVRWALDDPTADEVAARVKSSRRHVQDWVPRWNRDGLAGLED